MAVVPQDKTFFNNQMSTVMQAACTLFTRTLKMTTENQRTIVAAKKSIGTSTHIRERKADHREQKRTNVAAGKSIGTSTHKNESN